MRTLEAEQTAAGKGEQFARLRPFLAAETEAGDYRQIAAELGLKTGTVAVAVHRLRQRYQEIIRWAVRQTLLNPAELDDELRHLFGGGRLTTAMKFQAPEKLQAPSTKLQKRAKLQAPSSSPPRRERAAHGRP